MKRLLLIILTLCALPVALAQQTHTLRELVVTQRRPLKEIGASITRLDSASLKENIALSMADVLTFSSPVFVKSYGRATLSTVSFRGTSPSHTQVTWNGMKINSPMLGMTDFSTIPAYFIDNATLLHGTTSVSETGGGLGGLVRLSTVPDAPEGVGVQYVQGVGSFKTFDEFLRLTYANDRWTSSTRAVYSSSPNDYTYTNFDKMENVYDDEGNIIDRYHPRERNRSGAFKDLNVLQEVYYTPGGGNRFGLNAWYTANNRELPMLTTEYGDAREFENRQREETLRAILSWGHSAQRWSLDARAGYIHTWMAYDYRRDTGAGMVTMTRSRSRVNTAYGQASANLYTTDSRWMFTASLSAHQHFVRSEDRNVTTTSGQSAMVGYDKARIELSGSATARWQPSPRFGVSAVLRQEMAGNKWAPIIPALFVDASLVESGALTAKASVSRNYRFPTLNDLCFMPGGNPDLKSESGITYDCGVNFTTGKTRHYALSGAVSWFDSYIDDWIIWLPTVKGFFSPRNVKRVHAYGVEIDADLSLQLPSDWLLDLHSIVSWTPSINRGEPTSEADKSVGKQLPYVPRLSANITGRLSWRRWSFTYKWSCYSKRYTMSSNEPTISGSLPTYFMSNIMAGYGLPTPVADIDMKLAVNNIFNEHYLSVLARPMPGINFEFFVSITPKWSKSTSRKNTH